VLLEWHWLDLFIAVRGMLLSDSETSSLLDRMGMVFPTFDIARAVKMLG